MEPRLLHYPPHHARSSTPNHQHSAVQSTLPLPSSTPMCTSRDVQNWLLNLPDRAEIPCGTAPPIARPESKKRKSRHDHVLTPPGSDHDLNTNTQAENSDNRNITSLSLGNAEKSSEFETPMQKRRRLVPNPSDPDETPRNLRPSESVSQAGSSMPQSQSSRHSTASVSRPSRTKPPTRQLGATEISKNPVRVFALDSIRTVQDIDARPGLGKLRETVNAISRIAKGKGIIPRHDAEKIEASDPDIDLSESSFYDAGDMTEQRYGPAPSFEEVNRVVLASQYGIRESFDEASWDCEVHFLLLSLALRRRLSPVKDGLVNFTPSITAAIHSDFMKDTPACMVDYCLYVDPGSAEAASPALSEAMKYVRQASGYSSINHTPYFLLRDKPISLSIASQQRGASLDDAHLRIGTWHAAQWAYLERLATKNGNTLEGLAFLPGMIVQAEDWHFMASTREGTSTVLWSKKIVGSTTEVEGTYQVIRTIQYLAWWTKEMYWPWFVSTILGLDSQRDALEAVASPERDTLQVAARDSHIEGAS